MEDPHGTLLLRGVGEFSLSTSKCTDPFPAGQIRGRGKEEVVRVSFHPSMESGRVIQWLIRRSTIKRRGFKAKATADS
ncbi:MAG: hypothetical protein M1813_006150 [Trichoglossum hirsutum]|nr:MAG: hypothetical protein M1813_006150 [Trichoglossum hirsutum]